MILICLQKMNRRTIQLGQSKIHIYKMYNKYKKNVNLILKFDFKICRLNNDRNSKPLINIQIVFSVEGLAF